MLRSSSTSRTRVAGPGSDIAGGTGARVGGQRHDERRPARGEVVAGWRTGTGAGAGAGAGRRVGDERSAVGGGDAPGDGESETVPTGARAGSVRLEQRGGHVGRDTGAVVGP